MDNRATAAGHRGTPLRVLESPCLPTRPLPFSRKEAYKARAFYANGLVKLMPSPRGRVAVIHRIADKGCSRKRNFRCRGFWEVRLPHARRLLLGWRTRSRPEHIP